MQDRWDLAADKTPGFGPIAERFRRAGELDRAVDLCREGLAQFPNHLSGRVTLGWALIDLGRYDEARLELERVLKRAPDNLAAIRGLAELHDRADNAMFVPAEPQAAWPPRPAAAPQAIGWQDPDQVVTAAPTAVASTPAIEPEITEDELPVLLAQLDGDSSDPAAADPLPVSASASTPGGDPADVASAAVLADAAAATGPAGGVTPARDPVIEADGDAPLVSLQAVIEELNAAVEPSSIDAVDAGAPGVAEFAAADLPNLDEVISALAREAEAHTSEPAAPEVTAAHPASVDAVSEAVVLSADSGDLVLELPLQTDPGEALDLASELFPQIGGESIPAPVVDLLEDSSFLESHAPLAFEADAVLLAGEPAIEILVDTDIGHLFDAPEDAGTAPRLEAAFGAASAAVDPVAIRVDVPAVELPVELEASRPDSDADPLLDSAMYALAEPAAADHAPPCVERVDDAFDLEVAPAFEAAAPEQSQEFPEPEPALTMLAVNEPPAETPAAAAGLDVLPGEFHVPDHVAAVAAREPRFESGFDVSDDFASALKSDSDFASPQVAVPEPLEADLPVSAVEYPDPAPADQWPEPEDVAGEAVQLVPVAIDPPADLEVRYEPAPEPAPGEADLGLPADVTTAAPAAHPADARSPARRRTGRVAELERFLRQIERRKLALARESAA